MLLGVQGSTFSSEVFLRYFSKAFFFKSLTTLSIFGIEVSSLGGSSSGSVVDSDKSKPAEVKVASSELLSGTRTDDKPFSKGLPLSKYPGDMPAGIGVDCCDDLSETHSGEKLFSSDPYTGEVPYSSLSEACEEPISPCSL